MHDKKQAALDYVISRLKLTGTYGAKVILHVTALGTMASLGGAGVPPELGLLVNGIGVNLISNLIERVARGEQVHDKEIQHQAESHPAHLRLTQTVR